MSAGGALLYALKKHLAHSKRRHAERSLSLLSNGER
jgi:hypothetical protein